MFTLCIPTIDRFDKFLSRYLPEYINNGLINEIIITDENGNDIDKIEKVFNSDKLKLFKNSTRLGPFLNKLSACSRASNEWIVLIDSDNFADEKYFQIVNEYIHNNILGKNVILAPCFAKPRFNYSHLSGFIYKKGSFNNNRQIESTRLNGSFTCSETLMNTGNYVINKYLIENLNLTNETENIRKSSACDVIYFNTLLFEQLELNLHVVPNLEYDHVVHDGSVYIQTHQQHAAFNSYVYKRYNSLQ
jgi:hypothetical protein